MKQIATTIMGANTHFSAEKCYSQRIFQNVRNCLGQRGIAISEHDQKPKVSDTS